MVDRLQLAEIASCKTKSVEEFNVILLLLLLLNIFKHGNLSQK